MISRSISWASRVLGLQRWSRQELAAAAAVALILVIPITSKVGYSGAWDGDPSIHNLLTRDAVNVLVDEHAKGGDPFRAFLQCYNRYPKMLHEIFLTVFIIAVNGMRHVSFGDVERYGAWFATLWTLAGAVVLYNFLRLVLTRLQSLAVMPMAALSGYILMYANFPRQNMASHVLCWLALLVYIRSRLDREAIPVAWVLTSGILFGIAVAVHYSATYIFFAFAGTEAALLFSRRSPARALGALVLCFAGATLVWFLTDLYYFRYSGLYPDDKNAVGLLIRDHHSFLEGMTSTASYLDREVPNFKLVERKWWFLFGFYYRCMGPVASLLAVLGVLSFPWPSREKSRVVNDSARETVAVLGAVLLVSVLVSLGYFQNARKLMPFYPVWCVFLGYGLFALARWIGGFRPGTRAPWRPGALGGNAPLAPPRPWRAPAVVLLLVAAHFAAFGPALYHVYQCRRDAGYMREFLAEHGIGGVLVAPVNVDSQMAPLQADIRSLTLGDADKFEYLVTQRLYKKQYSEILMNRMRDLAPIVSFQNQAATPLFWYEFPLKKEFMDLDDPLTNERRLYRWRDVRPLFAQFCEPSK